MKPEGSLQPARIAYLDGIRCLAILAVVGVHWLSPYVPFFYGGYIGVDIFFVLSGYIITLILFRGRRSYGTFIWGRVRRLYPALTGVLVAGSFAAALVPGSPVGTTAAIRAALLSAAQLVSPVAASGTEPPLFGFSWSLSVEWYFYLLWALLVIRLRSSPPRRLAALTAGAAVLLYLLALPLSSHAFYFGPPAHMAELLAGSALAFKPVQAAEAVPRVAQFVALAAVVASAAWLVLGPVQWSPLYKFIGAPLGTVTALGLIIVGRLAPTCRLSRALSIRPATLVGRVSYSLYLWHSVPMGLLTRHTLDLPLPLLGLLGIGSALIATAISYRLLEVPHARSGRGSNLKAGMSEQLAGSQPARWAPLAAGTSGVGRGAVSTTSRGTQVP